MAVPTDAPPAGREGERARALASLLCDSLASRGTAVSEDQRRSWAGLFYRLHERGYRNRDMRRALRYALSSPAWRERMTDAEAFARHLDELLAQSGGDAA